MVFLSNVYKKFLEYFGDIRLSLFKRESGWCIYGIRVGTGLARYRYIFVIIPEQKYQGDYASLSQLEWVSFQTRTTEEYHATLDEINFFPTPEQKEALSDIISHIDRTSIKTTYVCDLPVSISLMHDPKKRNYLQYPDKAKLYQALDSFNCVIETL